MEHDTGERVPVECGCGARIRVPAAALGRKARCPKCRRILVLKRAPARGAARGSAESPAAAGTSGEKALADENITFRCACGVKLAVPATLAGRKAKCPKCQSLVAVPMQSEPAASQQAVDSDDVDSLVAGLMKGEAVTVAPASRTGPVSRLAAGADLGESRTCPSCHKSLPGNAVICTDCGINLRTGRALMTTQDEKLDQIYAYTESILRWLSWIFPSGLYPMASEAFGLRKPWVTRGIAVVTILVSVWFMIVYIYNPGPSGPGTANLMLWCGQKADWGTEWRDDLTAELRAEGYSNADIRAMLDEMEQVEYRPHQLITHAFLHGGPLHLAGNLLFLMVLGSRVNALIGNVLTLILYPLLAIAAGAAHMAASAGGVQHPMLGASGAVMGLAGMYLVFFPLHKVHMVFWWRWGLIGGFRLHLRMFAVRGFWVVLFYIAFDVLYTAFGLEDDVAHWAHLGGFLTGAAIALILMFSRLVNARGSDMLSAILGKYAWRLLGKPNRPGVTLW